MFKKLLKQKTTWAGLSLVIGGLAAGMTGDASWGQALQASIVGLMGIFMRQGIAKGK